MQRHGSYVGKHGQRPLCRGADPSPEHRRRDSLVAHGCGQSVVELRDGSARGKHIALRAYAAAISEICGFDLQAGLFTLLGNDLTDALAEVTFKPRTRRFALKISQRQGSTGVRSFGFACEAFGTCVTFVVPR